MIKQSAILWVDPSVDAAEIEARAAQLRSAGYADVKLLTGTADDLVRAICSLTPALLYLLRCNPADLCAIRALRAPILLDGKAFGVEEATRLRDDVGYRDLIAQALARLDGIVDATKPFRLAVEDALAVGVPAVSLTEALQQLKPRVAVALGEGIGNMMNAVPMLRWLSKRLGRRISVIIHGAQTQGVQLFNDSPWIDFVYPGFEYTVGRHYDVLVSSAIAAHLEPLCTATTWIQQNRVIDYNLHGRFVRESDVYFMGLADVFGPTPEPGGPLELAALRDVVHAPESPRIIGIANGIKTGTWAKRQWPHIQALAERLMAEGWTIRCFGMGDEYVPGTENRTDLSVRDTIYEMAKCAYFIGHDGGMCHMAEALGVPTLWFFGPTAMLKNGPIYQQSEQLSSWQTCSPCNFKLDWLRCDEPVCMTELTVDMALEAFARMRKRCEELGPAPLYRPVSGPAITHELENLERPSRPAEQARSVAERMVALPRDAGFVVRMLAELLRAGDLEGARSLAAASSQTLQDELVLKAAHGALETLHGAAESPPLTVASDVLVDAVLALQLPVPASRALVELLFGAFVRAGRVDDALQLFERVYRRATGTLSSWSLKQWLRAMSICRPEGIRERLPGMSGLSRTHKGLAARLRAMTDEGSIAEEWAAFRSQVAADPTAASPLAPARTRYVDAGAPTVPVVLDLPDGPLSLAPWSTVLLVVPSCDPTSRWPGSCATAVVWLARALSSLGLCPVIVSAFQATDRPRFDFRDNVTYVNGARLWTPAFWNRLIGELKPRLVLSVADVASELGLEFAADVAVRQLSAHGLFDVMGLAAAVSDEMVALAEPADSPGTIGLDSVIAALPIQPPSPPSLTISGQSRVLIMVNDLSDLTAALHIVRRCPDLPFTILSDLAIRSSDPNLRLVRRKPNLAVADLFENLLALVQFRRSVTNLSAEALDALRKGLPVVASSELTRRGPYKVVAPADPKDTEAWVAALRGAIRTRLQGAPQHRLSQAVAIAAE